jgi:TPR repeat protein
MTIPRYLCFLACGLWLMATPVAAEEITECDLQAAHPSDPQHMGPGVSSGAMILQKAIPACRAAVAANPESARAQYQLARSLVYWADANGADISEGMEHLEIAAGMDYTQALFVLGLMYRRGDRVCEIEALTRKAADQGLKSARLTYVDDVVSGFYQGCEPGADKAAMVAYLDAAVEQVNGYYEGMLLGALKRELNGWEQ